MSRPKSEGRAVPDRRDVLAGLASASIAAALPAAAAALPAQGRTTSWEQAWGLYNESHLFFVEWEL